MQDQDYILTEAGDIGMIACILGTNCFERLMESHDTSGMIDNYERISRWAKEFHDKYKDFDWELLHTPETVPADFPYKAGCWDDVVREFGEEKMKMYPAPYRPKKMWKMLVTNEDAAYNYLTEKGCAALLNAKKKFKEGNGWYYEYFDTEGEMNGYIRGVRETFGWDRPRAYVKMGLVIVPDDFKG